MPRTWEDPPEYRPDDSYGQGGTPQLAWPKPTKATRLLLIANTIVFVASFALFLSSESSWASVAHWLGLRPAAWRESFPLVPLWQVLTYGFLHQVTDIFHLLFNLLVLYFFGTMLEEILGTRRFLLTYFGALLAGALFFLVGGSFGSGQSSAIGASGAVFGVMVAAATLRPKARVLLVIVPVTLAFLALILVGIEVFRTALSWKQGADGVAHLVHLGGIAYGYLAARSGLVFADPLAALARSRAARDVERRQGDEARMDQLLDKINREGMSSLTRGEKDFLKRVSSRR
jgi:membrane associated rhomboid family serine protease